MDLKQAIQNKPPQEVAAAVETFLQGFVTPAFGALPKAEIELLVLTLLESIGAISSNPVAYELVSKLKVTRTKARSLMYERELRRLLPEELDSRVREILKRPLIQKQGELFVLEVENPLVSDHLRSKVQQLGYISDGSFSPSIVKLPLDAIVALIEFYVGQEKEQVRNGLVAAGAPDTSFRGVLKSVLKKVASRVASESGEALLEKASEYIGPIVDAVTDGLTGKMAGIYSQYTPQDG